MGKRTLTDIVVEKRVEGAGMTASDGVSAIVDPPRWEAVEGITATNIKEIGLQIKALGEPCEYRMRATVAGWKQSVDRKISQERV